MNDISKPSQTFINHVQHQFNISPKKAGEWVDRVIHELAKQGISWAEAVNVAGGEMGILTWMQRVWNDVGQKRTEAQKKQPSKLRQSLENKPAMPQQKSPVRQNVENLLNNFQNVGFFQQKPINNNTE